MIWQVKTVNNRSSFAKPSQVLQLIFTKNIRSTDAAGIVFLGDPEYSDALCEKMLLLPRGYK